MEKLIITPKTKVYDLLEAYPQLETTLIEMAPPFRKLKNPVLRKTIAKVTSLSQAAVIAGLDVETMVNRLRTEAGQEELTNPLSEKQIYTTECPEWYNESNVVNSIDIRDMLNAGEQPVHEVLSKLKKLGDDEILKIIAPFTPAPLIDKSVSLNYRHWLLKKSDELFWVYFSKG